MESSDSWFALRHSGCCTGCARFRPRLPREKGRGLSWQIVRNVQTEITVCPYDDCALAGRHLHDGTTYCGYAHGDGLCDGLCRALCPLEDCVSSGRHYHGYSIYCGAHHDGGFCDGSCTLAP